MTGRRFETGIHVNVGSEGLVIQQTPGASAMPLQILSHDATPVFMVHTSGEVTAPMGVNIGAASKTEIEHLAGVSANVQDQLNLKSPIASPTFTGTPAAPTAGAGTNTTQIATTQFVRTELSNLVASAPSALDTLNELATALGNDASFSTTVTNNLALKAPLESPTFTGTVNIATLSVSGNSTIGTVISGTWQGSTISATYLPSGSTSALGVVQLINSNVSNSNSLAVTANAVRELQIKLLMEVA
jgi:hypothetical protein